MSIRALGGRASLLLVGAGMAAASVAAAGAAYGIVDAVKDRDTQAVQVLISERVDVNTSHADGATALHWAAHWDDVDVADMLIRAGAQVNATNDYGVAPLVLAATNGSRAMVERLLSAGADPNTADNNGATALMFAVRTGKIEVVEALLAASGVDVDAKDVVHGQTALMWAASEGHFEVERLLIGAGADVGARSKSGYTPVLFAVRGNHGEAVQVLLDHEADINESAVDGTTALVVATVHGHWPLAHALLEHGADPNADGAGFAALHWVAGIWDTGLTTTAAGGTAGWGLLASRGPGKLQLVKALLAHGADPNARIEEAPPQHGFKSNRRIAMAGATPFIVAARGAQLDIMRALVDAGADPLATTDDETTALVAAAGYAYSIGEDTHPESDAVGAATLIIELGVDVNAANKVGETAIHAIAYTGWDRVGQLLLDNGAYVDAQNIVGWTPLAIASGYFDLTTMTKTVHKSTMALLEQYGAAPTPPAHEQKRLRY